MKKGPMFLLLAMLIAWTIARYGDRYVLHLATMISIMGILALSMNLMLRIGQLSIAHGAFMGMGAYASAILTMRAGMSPPVALVLGALITAVIAAVLGRFFLRIKGVYFVLLTYAFGQIINLVFQDWTSLFGGNNGILGIPKFSWMNIDLAAPSTYFVLTFIFLALAFVLTRWIFSSSMGAVLSSIDEDETLCQSLGANVLAWRSLVFVLSAVMASLAGGLYAHHVNFLTPEAFGFMLSVDLVVMNILGGVSAPLGPVLGACILVLLPELLREVREFQMLAYGAILLLCLMYFKDGLIGLFHKRRGAR